MGCVYTRSGFEQLYREQFQEVLAWFAAHEGKTVQECATALSVPYALVWHIVEASDLVYLPTADTDVSFPHKRP